MISKYAEGAHRLLRIKEEGNEVALFIDNDCYKETWDGILPKVKKWEDFIDQDTTVLFDQSGFGDKVDYLRRKGVSTWGGSELADKLEKDRVFGMEYAKKWGIRIPDYFEFSDLSEGVKFLKNNKGRFVFKPEGDDIPCRLTYCEEDLLGYLEDFISPTYGSKIKKFVLQEFIDGVDISTEAWISNGKIVPPINRTIEAKNFMNDDKGPLTGGEGNIVWTIEMDDPIYKLGLEKVAESYSFFQQLDVNGVMTEEGEFYFLEFTPRDGYPATPTLLHLVRHELGELYYNLAREEQKEMDVSSQMAGSVMMTVPPYPTELPEDHELEPRPLRSLPSEYKSNYYFYEVKIDENKHLVHTGESGSVGMVIGTGYDPEECLSLPYEILEKVRIPDLQYRTDLAKVFTEELEKLENVLYNSYRTVA